MAVNQSTIVIIVLVISAILIIILTNRRKKSKTNQIIDDGNTDVDNIEGFNTSMSLDELVQYNTPEGRAKLKQSAGYYPKEMRVANRVYQHGFSHSLRNEPVSYDHWLPGYRRKTTTMLVSLKAIPLKDHQLAATGISLTLPDTFNEWVEKGWSLGVRDQKDCGGCYTFSVSEILASRFSIATGGAFQSDLSTQYLLSCYNGLSGLTGCGGGIPYLTLQQIQKYGTIPEELYPYVQSTKTCVPGSGSGESMTCKCANLPKEACIYKPNNVYGLSQGNQDTINWAQLSQTTITQNVERMKTEIYLNGPISIGIQVYEDFYNFVPQSDKIYVANPASGSAGGHAVTIVGWGKDVKTGVDYWICQNSWGLNWGYSMASVGGPAGGFWNHVMGENSAFIESYAVAGFPDLTAPCIAGALPQNQPDGTPYNWKDWNGSGNYTLRHILEIQGLTDSKVYTS